jgi:hypothetical protein
MMQVFHFDSYMVAIGFSIFYSDLHAKLLCYFDNLHFFFGLLFYTV